MGKILPTFAYDVWGSVVKNKAQTNTTLAISKSSWLHFFFFTCETDVKFHCSGMQK